MADEFLLMGLRLTEGIDPRGYAQISGRSLDPRRLAILNQEGAVEITAGGTAAGYAGRVSGAGCGGGGSGGLSFLNRAMTSPSSSSAKADNPVTTDTSFQNQRLR